MISHRSLTVDVDSTTQFATVRHRDTDQPAATLRRARIYETGPTWHIYSQSGVELGNGFTVARCLRLAHAHMNPGV